MSFRLEDLEHWFCGRGYKKEMIHSKIQTVYRMNTEDLLRKRKKKDKNDRLTMVLRYHPALNKVHEILKKVHRHTIRSRRFSAVLLSHPPVTFHNPKALKDYSVRSKLQKRTLMMRKMGCINVVTSTVI